MTIHKGTLEPDTCGCVIKYEWDDANPDVHSYTDLLRRCKHHPRHLPHEVFAENARKNWALRAVHEALPAHCFFDGHLWQTEHGPMLVHAADFARYGLQHSDHVTPVRVLHKKIRFSHDEQRNLVLHIESLDDGAKRVLHQHISGLFDGVSVK